ncbi:MAG TPA: NfeD family protein [Candidatus Onthousia excrementipullorum]|uniref:NfeD family protein n=1 Tax=Candidatus Onthousia excrementipullorum TaxID=2840884 RepID=A0A9D1J3L4_9FIRM|nr:NfeD family protein [Candidatus Onthousia excrementipullorum]
MTLFWLVLFVILALFELATVNLVSIWFAIGAIIATFVSLVTDNIMIHLAVFTITSILLLLLTKPFVKKIKKKDVVPTNLDRVIGKVGVVTEKIEKDGIGEVKVLGKRWSAYSDKEIKENCKVKVLSINGVKLKVEEFKESD